MSKNNDSLSSRHLRLKWYEIVRMKNNVYQKQQQHKLYLHDYNYVVTVLQKL